MIHLNRRIIAAIAGITTVGLLVPTGTARAHSSGIYATETEAAVRAEEIGCTTVHQNNGRWMPCSDEQELHRQLRQQ